MFRAILFDFDGVILDSEELHYEAFRRVFEEEGVSLAREAYYRECLGFNDVECIRWGLVGTGKIDQPGGLETLTRRKSAYYDELLDKEMRFFPGVCDFIREAGEKYPLSVTSMARRSEIEAALHRAGLFDLFSVIVSGEDVKRTKPDPEAYETTLFRLNVCLDLQADRRVRASECLVIEDSAAGIESAKGAGMHVLGLAHTEGVDRLQHADRVLPSLEGVTLGDLLALFGQ